jgi:hypothetical protein
VIQLKTTCRIKRTAVGTETVQFTFSLGPLMVLCIANIPEEGKEEATVYVKLDLVKGPVYPVRMATQEWTEDPIEREKDY